MKARLAIAAVMLILLVPGQSRGQKSEAWLDFIANWSPEGVWSYELNPGLAKGLGGAQWVEVYVASTATYQPFNWLSTEGNLEAHYTYDRTTENVIEIRPWLGFNFIWATFGNYLNLFYPFVSFRLEERLRWYQPSGTFEAKTRARLRLSTRFTLNNETLVQGTYYLLFLAETYAPLQGDLKEVSADRRRFQAGIGYVIELDTRMELHYVMMRTRDTYTNSFEEDSRIFWLAVKHFF